MYKPWTSKEYLKKRNQFQNEVAATIRRLEIDEKSCIDSFRLASALYDYVWFYSSQINGMTPKGGN